VSLGFGFFLKKVISALLMPLSIGIIFIVLGLWQLKNRSIKRAKLFLTISVIWTILVSSLPFATFMIEPLEKQYPKLKDTPKDIKYILLLGGDKESRSWEALRLYNLIPNSKIITSGYMSESSSTGAIATAKLLESIGVKGEDILMQSEAKDTEEEAIAMRKRVKSDPFILVTSAYQMPRAMMIFKKHGLNPTPAPTDFKARDGIDILLHSPKGRYLYITERAWHEYLGILWFKLKSLLFEKG
jgi:uncharacterized SAM-binding protein YcdF (DUF218 family)